MQGGGGGGQSSTGNAKWQEAMASVVPTPTRPPTQPPNNTTMNLAGGPGGTSILNHASTAQMNGSTPNTSEDEAYRAAQMKRRKEILDAHVEKQRETWEHPKSGMEETMIFHRSRALIDISTISQSFVCRASGIQNAALSQYLRGIFKGRQDVIEDKLEQFLNDYLEGKYDGQARRGIQGKRRHTQNFDTTPNGRRQNTPEHAAMMVNYQQRVAQQNALLAQQRHAALLRQQQEFHQRHHYGAAAAPGIYGHSPAAHAQQHQQHLLAQRVAAAQAAGRHYPQQHQLPPQQQPHQYLSQRDYIIRQQQIQHYQMQLARQQQQHAQKQQRAVAVASRPKPTAPPLKPLPPTVAVERAFHAYHSSNLDIICTNSEPLLLPIEIDVQLADDEDVGVLPKSTDPVQTDKSTNAQVQTSNDSGNNADNANNSNSVQNMEVENPVDSSSKEKSQKIDNVLNQSSKQLAENDNHPVNGSDNRVDEESSNKAPVVESENSGATADNRTQTEDENISFPRIIIDEIVTKASSSETRKLSDVVESKEQSQNSDVKEKNDGDSSSVPVVLTGDTTDVTAGDRHQHKSPVDKEPENSSNAIGLQPESSSAEKSVKAPENANSDVAMKDSSEIVAATDVSERPDSSKVGDTDDGSTPDKQDAEMTDVVDKEGENRKREVANSENGPKSTEGEKNEKEGDAVMKVVDSDTAKDIVENVSEISDEPKQPLRRRLLFYTQWDVNEKRLSPEEVAESIVKTRNCAPALIPKISAQIRRQLFDGGIACPVPPAERSKENRRRISIRVILREDSDEVIEDTFDWDICMGEYNSPELFAQHLCSDCGVSQFHVPQVAQAIRQKIVLAQAIAYGDDGTREAALARLGPSDPLREKLAPCKTGVKRLSPEEIRALHEKHVNRFVVQPLIRNVEHEIDRREEQRMAREEERRFREKEERKRMEEEEMRKREAREEEERKKRKYLTGLDTANAKLGVQLDRYLGLKLGRGTSPSVWVEGIFIRKKRGLVLMPAAVEEEAEVTQTPSRGRGRPRRGRRSAAATDGEEKKTTKKRAGKRSRESTGASGSTTTTKRRTSKRSRK